MSQKNRKSQVKANRTDYNGWRVLYFFIEGVFNLINSNKIYPVFGLLFLLLIGLIVWRLPDTELAEILKLLINEFVVDKGGLIVLIVVTNLGWAFLLKKMANMYKREIARLSAIRSELMHNSNRKNIGEHRSTNSNCKESYIVAGADVEEKRGE